MKFPKFWLVFPDVVVVVPVILTVAVGCHVAKGRAVPFLAWLYSELGPKTIFAVAELEKLPPVLVIFPLTVTKVPALAVFIFPFVPKTNSPSITAEALAAKVILSLLVPLMVSVAPESTIQSTPVPLFILKF